jgi:hypothetical protein
MKRKTGTVDELSGLYAYCSELKKSPGGKILFSTLLTVCYKHYIIMFETSCEDKTA